MKEMTSVATTMMTEEEKAEIERELKGKGASPAVTSSPPTQVRGEAPHYKEKEVEAEPLVSGDAKERNSEASPFTPSYSTFSTPKAGSPTPSATSKEKEFDIKERERRKQKPTLEQKQKLEALEKERREAMDKRVKELHRKLVER